MFTTLLLGAALGGIVAFIWGAISWMVLPWHNHTLRSFNDDDAVARAITDNAPVTGVYTLPSHGSCAPGMSPEQRKAAQAVIWEKMKAGPLMLAVVQRRGFQGMGLPMLGSLGINALSAFILTTLLQYTSGLSFVDRVAFVSLAALSGTIFNRLSDWNWHGYSRIYTAVMVADAAVCWTLVGIVLASLT